MNPIIKKRLDELEERGLRNAYAIARQSKDPSSQNGAIVMREGVVLTTGANNFPIGVEFNAERSETRPLKYDYFEHAERNAIYMAARAGKATHRSTMFCPWAACADCARGIIQAGISEVVVHRQRMAIDHDRWEESIVRAHLMFEEAGVQLTYYDGPVWAEPILVSGEFWNPAHVLMEQS